MREVERIDRILKELRKIWKKYPDQRFGQLLINLGVCEDTMRNWSSEDVDLEKFLVGINKKKKVAG